MDQKDSFNWIQQVTQKLKNIFPVSDASPLDVMTVLHRPYSSILRFGFQNQVYWYKQNPYVFRLEGALTDWVYAKVPGAVPKVIYHASDWFITQDVIPVELISPACAYASLAQIQLKIIGSIGEATNLGCHKRNTQSLIEKLISLSTKGSILPSNLARRLDSSLMEIEKQCLYLDSMNFPETLVHGDLTQNNIIWTSSGWVIIDWSDAAIANPVMDLTMAMRGLTQAQKTQLFEVFFKAWNNFVPAGPLASTIAYVDTIGALYQAESHIHILQSIDNSKVRGDIVQLCTQALVELERV